MYQSFIKSPVLLIQKSIYRDPKKFEKEVSKFFRSCTFTSPASLADPNELLKKCFGLNPAQVWTFFNWYFFSYKRNYPNSKSLVSLQNSLDQWFFEYLYRMLSSPHYDPMSGTIACGRAILTRIQLARSLGEDHNETYWGQKIIEIIHHLAAIRIPYGPYKLWPSNFNNKYVSSVNLGGGHGLPAVLLFLAWSDSLGFQNHLSQKMVNDLISFFEKYFDENGLFEVTAFFPPLDHEKNRSIRRAQWCYGPFSIGIQLYFSSQFLGTSRLRSQASELTSNSCKINQSDDPFLIPHLCHGPMGTAYLYWRLFAELQNDVLLYRSFYWRQIADKMLIKRTYNQKMFSPKSVSPLLTSVGIDLASNSLDWGAWTGWDFMFGLPPSELELERLLNGA